MIRALIALLLGLTLTFGLGPLWIPFFKRLKFGQYIREDGPQAHLAKAGTPTFGGLMFMSASLVGLLVLWPWLKSGQSVFVILAIIGFGAVGFADDYIKVVKKNNLGLRAWQKVMGIAIVTGTLTIVFFSELSEPIPFTSLTMTSVYLVVPFFIFVAMAITNAVNLTDGIDGLCASVTLVVALFFAAVAFKQHNNSMMLINLLIAGSLLGYLFYNWHPAKVFMGDTGSLALGGFVLANGFALNIAWFIPLFGLVYLVETLSVVIQVAYFKRTGKRFFKMAPIHHHFEMMGWKEKRIALTASAITATLSFLVYILI